MEAHDDEANNTITNTSHRNLSWFHFLNNLFADPKSVQNKQALSFEQLPSSNYNNQDWRFPLDPSQMVRPINILAFGGSVTWGAKLKDHRFNYVRILTPYPDRADNLAMRATGADYPSLCLESMIASVSSEVNKNEKNYDLILFDFVINNTDGFPLLLKRLRQRYPDAIIVYVHIWSLLHLMEEANTKRRPHEISKSEWNATQWAWKDGDTFQSAKLCGREVCEFDEMSKLVTDVGGYVYFMPRPNNLTPREVIAKGWFGSDLHHLTSFGHRLLADGILQLLNPLKNLLFNDQKRLGSFGKGDQCYNWFETGQMQLEIESDGKGTTMVDMLDQTSENPQDKKYVLEIDSETGAKITFRSKFDFSAPVGLGYMSQSDPKNYPLVEITINSQPTVLINPNKNKSFRGHPHITAFSHVGWAEPGNNVLKIRPTETTKYPFRVIGVYICGVCFDLGNNLGSGSQNKLDSKFESRMET